MLKLEPRPQASRLWTYGSPLLALAVTVLIGIALFMALGKDPARGLQVFFWEPIKSQYALGELMVKATPLLLIALGLAVCFRSNVWNIGAEGQFVIGAVVAGGVALLADKTTGPWIVPAILLAGVLGGMAWAGLTALLRDKFNANEILVSLMLVYVATLVLGYLVYGPWKDPMGYNFPQTKTFEKVTQIPRLMQGSRVSIGLLLALAGAAALWVFLFRTRAGFAQQVGGLAPAAMPAAKPSQVLPVCTTVAKPAMAAQSIMPSAPRLTMPAFSLMSRPRAAMASTVPALSVAPIRSAYDSITCLPSRPPSGCGRQSMCRKPVA